jgi:hypothetical protein
VLARISAKDMASSSRYQSKLFNLLSRQVLHWREETARTIRKVKVAAVWGTQIVLYPIYALFQTARLTSRQFQQTVRRVLPRLQAAKQAIQQEVDLPSRSHPAPKADTPIYKMLLAVRSFELPVSIDFSEAIALPTTEPIGSLTAAHDSETAIAPMQQGELVQHLPTEAEIAATSPFTTLTTAEQEAALANGTQSNHVVTAQSKPLVRGIASLLETRSLVLVTLDNHLLDILTSEQQMQLRQRMVWEVAHYWRYQRTLHSAVRPNHPLPLPADNPRLLPPVRAFRQLMAWMQQGAIATALNLFQESSLLLATAPTAAEHLETANPEEYHFALERLWRRLSMPVLPALPTSNSVSWEEELAWEQTVEAGGAIVPMSPMQVVKSRLSGKAPVVKHHASPKGVVLRSPAGRVAKYQTQTGQLDRQVQSESGLMSQPNVAGSQRSDLMAPGSMATNATEVLVSQPLHSELEQPIPASDEPPWIEIQATVIGYVKHPLEQVLEWLDVGMSWLETRVARLWQWMRDRLP